MADTTGRQASVKAGGGGFQGTDLALIAVFAALVAVLSVIPPLFVVAAVPFALQMVAVMLAPLVLGAVRGGSALALYLVVGLLGLPVFAGQSSGPGVLLGATGGFLIGYVVAALVAGALATAVLRRRPRRPVLAVQLYAVALIDLVVVYTVGIVGMMVNASLSFPAAVAANGLFMIGDLVKALLAVAIAVAVLTAFPRLMPAARERR
ncbi:biotin transporter BioY [Acidipropionibacterium virtanenii]|uniref:Biotin transporter n=1 Tax=Acidipropionibacterium virtanenii TaxID=2057246 RepID=A0A344UTG2_9ACTN|nr:biotin transporter BioY [Acidipropionibacterium virtanenii]AXE38560.1 Biotin transporter BioY [Acidipropionibacterium virtanenii]